MNTIRHLPSLFPGIALCAAVAMLALAIEHFEAAWFGSRWLEGLVLAILLGTAICSLFPIHTTFQAGINFSAKTLLEIAIVLLGGSVSLSAIQEAGIGLVGGIVLVVVASLALGYGICRLIGLPPRLATLVACGNSICGNSAIAAAAPVIKADSNEIAASISFTAFLSVLVVLLLPILYTGLAMSSVQSGVLAGLTVYAVPQVLAAAAPAGAIGIQIGTLVKLIRVLMLGPVVFLLGIVHGNGEKGSLSIRQMVPWFIIGFLLMLALRSLDLIPDAALPAISSTSNTLTVVAMAALGLGVNIRSVLHSGGRVILAATLSLVTLGIVSLGLIMALGIA